MRFPRFSTTIALFQEKSEFNICIDVLLCTEIRPFGESSLPVTLFLYIAISIKRTLFKSWSVPMIVSCALVTLKPSIVTSPTTFQFCNRNVSEKVRFFHHQFWY